MIKMDITDTAAMPPAGAKACSRISKRIQAYGLFCFFVLALADSARATQGYEVNGYFVYTVFGETGGPVYKEVRLFNVKVSIPEWFIRTEPLEEGKNGIGYWEVCNTTNGDVIVLTGLAAAYDSNKTPLKSIRAIVNELGETNLNLLHHQTPIFHQNPSPAPSVTKNLSDNVAVARHYVGNVPPADESFASLLWFAYTKQTGLKGDSTETGLMPKIWDDGKPSDHEMRYAIWTNFENEPYLIKNAQFRWSGVDRPSDGSEIKVASSINSSDPAATYQVYATTNLAELVLPLSFELTRFASVRSISDRPKRLTSIVASVVNVSLVESPSTLAIEPPGKTVVSDYRFAAKETKGLPFTYSVMTNLSPDTNVIMVSHGYKAFAITPPLIRSKPSTPPWRWVIVLTLTALTVLPLTALLIMKFKKHYNTLFSKPLGEAENKQQKKMTYNENENNNP